MQEQDRQNARDEGHDYDVVASDHGSIWIMHTYSKAARDWFDENVGEDSGWQPNWPTRIVVEPRYVNDILHGLKLAGLEVQVG